MAATRKRGVPADDGGYRVGREGRNLVLTVEKPPYRVPSMAEVNAIPWNGLNVASTFSGAGGSCLGYRMAGYRVVYANEFVPAARETYFANAPLHTIVDDRDIRDVTADSILDMIGMKVGELDLLDGSPPCASFSTAGRRNKLWGKSKTYSDTAQVTDDLFFEYVRLLDGLQPKVFVAENVSGLIKGTAKGYFLNILARMKSVGYNVEARLLDAQWLGVPQMRQRLIFVGVRSDLKARPVHPDPLPYSYSVQDAIPDVASVTTHNTTSAFRKTPVKHTGPSPTIMAEGIGGFNTSQYSLEPAFPDPLPYRYSIADAIPDIKSVRVGSETTTFVGIKANTVHTGPSPTVGAASYGGVNLSGYHIEPQPEPEGDPHFEGYSIAPYWDKLRPGESSDKFFNLIRPHPDLPCPTVTSTGGSSPGTASVTHPIERRKFTIAELRRICGFPDDFILTGSYAKQWERLGRAVPPIMMRAVAETLRDKVFGRL
jgi:DNA (cytosine-5)-methyltransferase 1